MLQELLILLNLLIESKQPDEDFWFYIDILSLANKNQKRGDAFFASRNQPSLSARTHVY